MRSKLCFWANLGKFSINFKVLKFNINSSLRGVKRRSNPQRTQCVFGRKFSFRKIKAQNEAKRFAPRERNFNFELRAWATALSEFGALVLL